MPGGDRTGPAGLGPMTGRGAGFCAGYGVPGYINGPGRGYWGRGRGGGGRGWRNWFYATGLPGWARASAWGAAQPVESSPGAEAEALKREQEYLKQDLEDIEKRLKELQKESK